MKLPPIARVPLEGEIEPDAHPKAGAAMGEDDERLTIAEAKRRLALTFGVDPSNVTITIAA